MVIVVDTTAALVELVEQGDFRRFHVEARGDGGPAAVARLLDGAGAGRLEGEDAIISVGWVRDRAAAEAGAGWDEGFRAMLAFAATKGWLRDGGEGIQAHVVWGSSGAAPRE
jgi:hypothetical protein